MVTHSKTSLKAFTIIEVTLFLAISSLLMVGLIAGANSSISRQRYDDAVNDFAEYLRGVYSGIFNVSNDNALTAEPGRSPLAIYGKFIVFSEFDSPTSTNVHSGTIYSYDIVGKAVNSSQLTKSNPLDILKEDVQANIVDMSNCPSAASCNVTYYRKSAYTLPWQATIEDKSGNSLASAVLIVRSPASGIVYSYHYKPSITSTDSYDFHNLNGPSASNAFNAVLNELISTSSIPEDVNFCIDSDDNRFSNRRNVRILKSTSNSSGVSLIALDDLYDINTNKEGSVCAGR
ncbi:hypothetical protein IJH29_02510 [Candidatus Saccharibacteria bacterium]|nr:hypothetical protein [Candidatus Saccharibacteria bacterium]